ncbi:MAG: hypothetical protein WCK47_08720, partial [bacterium]
MSKYLTGSACLKCLLFLRLSLWGNSMRLDFRLDFMARRFDFDLYLWLRLDFMARRFDFDLYLWLR